MTTYSGGTISSLYPDLGGPQKGRTAGFSRIGPREPGLYIEEIQALQPMSGGEFSAGNAVHHVTPPENSYDGEFADVSPGLDWFDRVHILPRAAIDFGNIITAVDSLFIVHSAYRRTSVTLTGVVNNALPGVTLVDFPESEVLSPGESILDPASSLEDPIKTTIRALTTGLAAFDAYIYFSFDSGEVLALHVLGSRIALLPHEFDGDVEETLEFVTTVEAYLDGTEQRQSLRLSPRQIFEVNYLLDGVSRQRFANAVHGWMGNILGIPLWHEKSTITAAVLAGATSLTFTTAGIDLRVGGYVVLITDEKTYEVAKIAAVSSGSVTLSDGLQSGWASGTPVMPMRLCRIEGNVSGTRYPVTLHGFHVRFVSIDNNTGANAGDVSAYPTFNSKVLLTQNLMLGGPELSTSFDQKVYVSDGKVGESAITTIQSSSIHNITVGFSPKTRAALWTLRQFLIYMAGRFRSFYLSNLVEDLVPVEDLTSGTNLMRVSHVDYTKYVNAGVGKNVIRIIKTDGTTVTRTITAAAVIDVDTEELTVDTVWSSTITVAEIYRIEYLEEVRFDTDEIRLLHSDIGRATVSAPVRMLLGG